MSGTTKAHIAIIIANLIYGFNYSIAKIALPAYVPAFAFVLIRVSAAALLFVIFHQLFVKEKVEKKDYLKLFLCGLTGVAINQSLFLEGLANTTEINAALLMITTPIIVLIASHFVLKTRITVVKIIGILVGTIGAVIIITMNGAMSFGSETWYGDLCVFINALSYGSYLVLVKPLMRKYHPITVIKWVFLFGFIPVVFTGFSQFQGINFSEFTPAVWGSVAYVVIATTFLAYMLNVSALKKVDPTVVSVYIYAQPLIAAFVSISIGNDELNPKKIVAGILIFLAVYLVSVHKGKTKAIKKAI